MHCTLCSGRTKLCVSLHNFPVLLLLMFGVKMENRHVIDLDMNNYFNDV